MKEDNRNLSLLTDFYELTMMQGYFKEEEQNVNVIFDVFFRNNPDGNAYSISCGLEQVIRFINDFHFEKEDIDYLASLGTFYDDFLDYLKDFKFTGSMWAIPEGRVMFPREPVIKIKAPLMQAQFLETAILNMINHQSLIATKSSRIVDAAGGDGVMEFGLRRAQGPDAGIYGARAAVIAGCIGTSNVLAGQMFDIPVLGTHAHSWIMSFGDELSAFRAYAKLYPDNCILLIDTYDTLSSGLPNAITVFKEMRDAGIKPKRYGIRMDSGDLAYISKKVKKAFDAEGFYDATISASNDLDEYLISSLKQQGAAINSWGVGTNLITSKHTPSLGGVYKLAAIEDKNTGELIPKIKVSENTEKVTNPGDKVIYRIYGKYTGKIIADLIALSDEKYSTDADLLLFDPIETWKKTLLKAGTYTMEELLIPVFIDGECVYKDRPTVMELREICRADKDTLWEESRRLTNPSTIHVDLSRRLWELKQAMLDKYRTV